jgi:hypothetical protein
MAALGEEEAPVPVPRSRRAGRRSGQHSWITTASRLWRRKGIDISERDADMYCQILHCCSIIASHTVEKVHSLLVERATPRNPVGSERCPVKKAALRVCWFVSVVKIHAGKARYILKQKKCRNARPVRAAQFLSEDIYQCWRA